MDLLGWNCWAALEDMKGRGGTRGKWSILKITCFPFFERGCWNGEICMEYNYFSLSLFIVKEL